MVEKNMFVDIHVLQTVPPSCINRDDTGSPKTAIYGGATRARVSSQSWKHAVREYFRKNFPSDQSGYRTKKILDLVEAEIAKLAPDQDAEKLARMALEYAGLKLKKKTEKEDKEKEDKGKEDKAKVVEVGRDVEALFFISEAQIKALAQLVVASETDKKAYKAALCAQPSVDMALFGRMVASDPSLNFDACCQVAHAISTHAVHPEYDYFTAVDDCASEDSAGAGHIGTKEFDSATLYRYATVNVKELMGFLGAETGHAVAEFAEAFINSMPTGAQNTYANFTAPDAIYVTVRDDQPVNLCGAFERPIHSNEGYVEASKRALCEYAKDVYTDFTGKPVKEFCVGKGMEVLEQRMSREELIKSLESTIAAYCSKEA